MNERSNISLDGDRRPVAVIAFGGNALLRPQDHGTQEEQFTLAWKATRWLYEIIHRGYELAIVHGNGPQVGNIMIQVEEAITKIPPESLDVPVAQTQGSMGYMLANQLRNRLHEVIRAMGYQPGEGYPAGLSDQERREILEALEIAKAHHLHKHIVPALGQHCAASSEASWPHVAQIGPRELQHVVVHL